MLRQLSEKESSQNYCSQSVVSSEKNLATSKCNRYSLQADGLSMEDCQKEITQIKQALNRTQIWQKEAKQIFDNAAENLREIRDQLLTIQQSICHLTDQKTELLYQLKEFQDQQSNNEEVLSKKRKLSNRILLIKGKIQLKEASKADLKDEMQCIQKTKQMISKHIDQRLEHMNQLYEDLNKYDCRILSIMKERSKLLQ